GLVAILTTLLAAPKEALVNIFTNSVVAIQTIKKLQATSIPKEALKIKNASTTRAFDCENKAAKRDKITIIQDQEA
ncbi:14406_t:CDS:1, partial [Gigaspora margarita]